MEIKQLEERIQKKKIQISKIEKKIEKLKNNLVDDNAFRKEYSWLERDGLWPNPITGDRDASYEIFKANKFNEYKERVEDEIKRANRDLEEASVTLKKYINSLEFEKAKQDKLSQSKIKILVDFLERWKEKVSSYIHNNVNYITKYYEINKAICDLHNNGRYKIASGELSKEDYKNQLEELEEQEKICYEAIDSLTFKVYDRKSENKVNETLLKEILDKEADNKYLYMVNAVTSKIGEITNVNALEIGPRGDLEGYITGTEGRVHVQTIGAGGYNQNVVLDSGRHGQCYHYRFLVKKIKN